MEHVASGSAGFVFGLLLGLVLRRKGRRFLMSFRLEAEDNIDATKETREH